MHRYVASVSEYIYIYLLIYYVELFYQCEKKKKKKKKRFLLYSSWIPYFVVERNDKSSLFYSIQCITYLFLQFVPLKHGFFGVRTFSIQLHHSLLRNLFHVIYPFYQFSVYIPNVLLRFFLFNHCFLKRV